MATQRTFTAEEAQKKFEGLPPEIKAILYTPEVTSAIQKVGEKNRLHYDKMGILEIEMSNFMLGFTEPKDFPEILSQSLGVDRVQADAIIQDLNDLLLSKIREDMKQTPATHMEGKSVIMPSAAKVEPAATNIPVKVVGNLPAVTNPSPAPITPLATPAPAKPDLHATDVILSEPTVSVAPKPAAPAPASPAAAPAAPTADATKPPPYKVDPYREPPE